MLVVGAVPVRYVAVMTQRPARGERPQRRASLTPVARGGLTSRVIEQLRSRIADGIWPLHHRLPAEAALAGDLGVGRSTVREAVRVLVHAGLLEVRQGDGTYVRSNREIDVALQRKVAEAHLLEAYEVRRAFEVEAARLAALRRSDPDVVRLRELLERRDAAYRAGGHEYRKADVDLFEHIVDITGNGLLADLYKGFMTPLRAEVAEIFGESELMLEDSDRADLHDLVRAVERADPHAAADAAGRRVDDVVLVLRLMLQTTLISR